jgi:tetratricopeptide (TPR) repeat protein
LAGDDPAGGYAMKWIQYLAGAIVFAVFLEPASALEDVQVDELRSDFESVIQGLNENSFDRFHRAIAKDDMTKRIFGGRIIEPEVKKAFTNDFSASVEQMFAASFPKSKTEILGDLIDFQFAGSEGRAVVRYASSGYRYSYHVYELGLNSRGRVVILDWIDYSQGNRFSDGAREALVMAMPSKPATRNILANKKLGEGEIFQAGELFKAVRDKKADRFFQIYDGMDEILHNETVIMRLNLDMSLMARDGKRIENAVRMLVEKHPDESLHSLRLVEYYIPKRQFQKAIDALVRLQDGIGVRDGATESLKASAALAMGNTEDAETYALEATVVEPSLELSWWSLLRARTRAENYSGAMQALSHLEDDFGHTLDPEKLKRDRFLKVLADKQEYLDWRASRE